MKIVEQAYNYLKNGIFIIYIIIFLGLSKTAPEYLFILENIFITLVACILIYFFNPLTKTICNDFHRNVAFSAGLAILMQLSLFRFFAPQKLIKRLK
jgi:hypothetical protein